MPQLVATGKIWDYIIEDEAEEGESGVFDWWECDGYVCGEGDGAEWLIDMLVDRK